MQYPPETRTQKPTQQTQNRETHSRQRERDPENETNGEPTHPRNHPEIPEIPEPRRNSAQSRQKPQNADPRKSIYIETILYKTQEKIYKKETVLSSHKASIYIYMKTQNSIYIEIQYPLYNYIENHI